MGSHKRVPQLPSPVAPVAAGVRVWGCSSGVCGVPPSDGRHRDWRLTGASRGALCPAAASAVTLLFSQCRKVPKAPRVLWVGHRARHTAGG